MTIMPKGKSITVNFKTLNKFSKAGFEFFKVFVKHGHDCTNQKQLCDLFAVKTGYSANYGSEIYSKLKPLLSQIVKKNFDVEYIRIPITSLAKFYNSKECNPKPSKRDLTF